MSKCVCTPTRRQHDEHGFLDTFLPPVSRVCEAEKTRGSLGPSVSLNGQAWKNRGWVGEEGVGNGGKEGRAEGLKKKHQVTVYIPQFRPIAAPPRSLSPPASSVQLTWNIFYVKKKQIFLEQNKEWALNISPADAAILIQFLYLSAAYDATLCRSIRVICHSANI